ncbi:Clp protease N-terminal domain-containing protein [Streptomyces sclerotialus]|uniref:Clp protease N-terminal domain-containing protein n=1 Tax=Streptomyces sclerotialus TaxID=1957 RepID=UPI0004C4BB8C
MFETFTASAREVVRGAAARADLTGSGTVGEEELLLTLLDQEGTAAAEALAALGVPARRAALEEALAQAEPRARGRLGRRPFTREAKGVLERSLRIALGRGEQHIGDEHLLLALTTGAGVATAVLADHGVTRAGVERVLAEPPRAA